MELRSFDALALVSVALNSLGERVSVWAPHLGVKLFDLGLSGDRPMASDVAGERSFGGVGSVLSSEFGYNTFVDALLYGGACELAGLNEVVSYLRSELAAEREKPFEKPGRVALSVDTNILILGAATRCVEPLPVKPPVLVSEVVLSELHRLRGKGVSAELVEVLRRSAAEKGGLPPDLASEAFPRDINSRGGRGARLADVELERLKRMCVVGYVPAQRDEKGDVGIASSIRRYGEEKALRIVHVTADEDALLAMRDYNVSVFLIDQAESRRAVVEERLSLTYRILPRLIYSLTVMLAAVRLVGDEGSIDLFAFWKGKKPGDWLTPKLAMAYIPQNPLHQRIAEAVNKALEVLGGGGRSLYMA